MTDRTDVLKTVRTASRGMDRDQIRAMLEDEYAARGVEAEPLIVERQVEMILTAREPFGRLRVVGRALKELRHSGAFGSGGIVDAATSGSDEVGEAPVEPRWLEPPDAAAYDMWSPTPRWGRVDLDPAARGHLDRIKRADSRRLAGGRELEVWLARSERTPLGDITLAVHIGSQKVGVLSGVVKERFSAGMRDAEQRRQYPRTRGRLSTVDTPLPYLLEIALPPDG
jgi:hypothetical protein